MIEALRSISSTEREREKEREKKRKFCIAVLSTVLGVWLLLTLQKTLQTV
jgi:hypothetical protein